MLINVLYRIVMTNLDYDIMTNWLLKLSSMCLHILAAEYELELLPYTKLVTSDTAMKAFIDLAQMRDSPNHDTLSTYFGHLARFSDKYRNNAEKIVSYLTTGVIGKALRMKFLVPPSFILSTSHQKHVMFDFVFPGYFMEIMDVINTFTKLTNTDDQLTYIENYRLKYQDICYELSSTDNTALDRLYKSDSNLEAFKAKIYRNEKIDYSTPFTSITIESPVGMNQSGNSNNTTASAASAATATTQSKSDAERDTILAAVLKKLVSGYKTVVPGGNVVGVNKFQLCIFSGCVNVPYDADELKLLHSVVTKVRNASILELQALKAALDGI